MQKTILQVPLNKQLKLDAEKAALGQGFSSLQEMVRVFLAKLASNRVSVAFEDTIYLSNKAEKRYAKMTEDFKKNKNAYEANSVEELVKQLNENTIS